MSKSSSADHTAPPTSSSAVEKPAPGPEQEGPHVAVGAFAPAPVQGKPAVPTVYQAWLAVMAEVQGIGKHERNQAQRFNFRGIDAVMNAVGPALRKHGVIVIPVGQEIERRDIVVGERGSKMREVSIIAHYRAYGPAGDHIDFQAPGESMDSGDKATPKAMSVAYRTLLLQALCIPTDEPDPDAQSYDRVNGEIPLPPVSPKPVPDDREQPGPNWTPEQRKKANSALANAGARKFGGDEIGSAAFYYWLGKGGFPVDPEKRRPSISQASSSQVLRATQFLAKLTEGQISTYRQTVEAVA